MMRIGCARVVAPRSDGCSDLLRLLKHILLVWFWERSPPVPHSHAMVESLWRRSNAQWATVSCHLHSIADAPPCARKPPDSPERANIAPLPNYRVGSNRVMLRRCGALP